MLDTKFKSSLIPYLFLALLLTFAHYVQIDSSNYEAQLRLHEEILRGSAEHPYNVRVLQPLAVKALGWALPMLSQKAAFQAGYLLIRFLSLLVTFFSLEIYAARYVSQGRARLAVALLAAVIPVTYRYYFYQPTSVLDLATFCLALNLVAARRNLLLFALVLFATLNRNTSVFIIGAYLAFHAREIISEPRERWVHLKISAGLAVVWLLVLVALERVFPGGGWVATPRHYIHYNLNSVEVWYSAALMLGPIAAAIFFSWNRAPSEARWLQLLIPPYLALHFVMSQADEIRYWLNIYAMAFPFLALSCERAYRAAQSSVLAPICNKFRKL